MGDATDPGCQASESCESKSGLASKFRVSTLARSCRRRSYRSVRLSASLSRLRRETLDRGLFEMSVSKQLLRVDFKAATGHRKMPTAYSLPLVGRNVGSPPTASAASNIRNLAILASCRGLLKPDAQAKEPPPFPSLARQASMRGVLGNLVAIPLCDRICE